MQIRVKELRALIESLLFETPTEDASKRGYNVSALLWDYDFCPDHEIKLIKLARKDERDKVRGLYWKCPVAGCNHTVSPGSGRPSGEFWREFRDDLDPESVFMNVAQAGQARAQRNQEAREELELPYREWLAMQPKIRDGVSAGMLWRRARDRFPTVNKKFIEFVEDARIAGICDDDLARNIIAYHNRGRAH